MTTDATPPTPSPEPAGEATGAAPNLAAAGILGAGADPAKAADGAPSWTEGLDDTRRAYVKAHGWSDPAALLESFQQAEKRISERGLTVPSKADDPRWADVWKALGRPDEASGYKLQFEGADPKMLEAASGWFHAAGLAPQQAKAVVGAFLEHQKASAAQAEALTQAREVESTAALRQAWGEAYERNIELAMRAGQHLGLSDDEMRAMRRTIGVQRFAELLVGIGKDVLAEDDANIAGKLNLPAGSAAEAQAQLDRLHADPAFMEKLRSEDPTVRANAVARRTELQKLAVGLAS